MVGQQLLIGALVIPALVLGGGLNAALVAQAAAYACVLFLVVHAMRAIDIGKLEVALSTMKHLFREGVPFLVLSVVITLQPIADGLILSKLSTPESMGWHAAARKLVGALVFPAIALVSALYPTLSRLHRDDPGAYRSMVSGGLRTATIAVIPVALGTFLFADVGIRIFNKETFGPAEDNLRVFSLFVFLLYFSMVLGASLAAAGRQRAWSVAQLACVAVSILADPFLIPYFERRVGNGGLGVCVSSVLSEVLMVGSGLFLTPRGILNRALGLGILRGAGAGLAMVAAALAMRPAGPLAAAPVSVVAYVVALRLLGGLDKEQVALLRSVARRKGGG
jgi:O-antigen/teichoic acid export membrane protein